jgi:hypothetical protein
LLPGGFAVVLGGAIAVLVPTLLWAEPPAAAELAFFESKVRPILVEHCYECHAVDAVRIEGGLVLDSKWGWQTGGDSGPAITPGDPQNSLLIEAIGYEENVVSGMPPKSKLPAEQIAILRQWIHLGAPDPRPKASPRDASSIKSFDVQERFAEHWSWRPIQNPVPPDLAKDAWSRRPIDRFILEKIQAAGLRPADPAPQRVWLRRVYFDLLGLPPTPEQIAEYLADDSPHAEQVVVEQLLRSPHFGEKWARHWMDLVRYADTYGHEFDYPIDHAFEYRDYLIRAFNADVGFDQLIREHIAGDLISDPRRHPEGGWNESIIGTGFWYLHEATHAPTDVLGNEADIIDNQLDVLGKAFLGLTIACSRCHDHKFDAISTADYYALSAYLQSSCRAEVSLDPGRKTESLTAQIDQLRQAAAEQLRSIDPDTVLRLRPGLYHQSASQLIARSAADGLEITESLVAGTAASQGLDPARLQRWIGRAADLRFLQPQRRGDTESGADCFADFDHGALPEGWSTSGFAFHPVGQEITLGVDGKPAMSGTVDSGLAGKRQVGVLRSPTFTIANKQIHVRIKSTADISMRVIIDNYQMAPFNGLLFRGTFFEGAETDTAGQWQWRSFGGDLQKYFGHRAYLEFIDAGEGAIAIDEIRFADGPPPSPGIPTETARHAAYVNQRWREGIDDLRAGRANPLIASLLETELLSIAELCGEAGATLASAASLADQIPAPRFVVAMAQGTDEAAHVYVRGSHQNLGLQVPARFIEALGGQQGSRLDLADLIASPDNPLTARVIVNRLWHHLLGRGLVPSVDDFGPQGQPPSHPELLDWLAHDFVHHGWSLQHTIAEIVLSQTYRQDSIPHSSLDPVRIADVDPNNELVHRMHVRRLPSESIRDAILHVSGRFDPTPFGPGVATHRTPFMSGRGARPSGPLDGDGRRSVYLSVYRNFLNPFLLAFDMPSPFGPKGSRSRSNVPAQSLTLMNDPLVIQQAETWARAELAAGELADGERSESERIASMVERAHGIEPTGEQIAALQGFLAQQAGLYGTLDHRAWADLAHSLLNMKSFYYLR